MNEPIDSNNRELRRDLRSEYQVGSILWRDKLLDDFVKDICDLLEHLLNDCPEKYRGEVLTSAIGESIDGFACRLPIYSVKILEILDECRTALNHRITEGQTEGNQHLAGRYVLKRKLASGGQGEIHLGYDKNLNREVAIKSILPDKSGSTIQQFRREVLIAGKLEHPNIVPVYEANLWPSDETPLPFFTMRLYPKRDLKFAIDEFHARIDTEVDSTVKRAEQLRSLLQKFLAACDAVNYAHSKGVVHCDLKPQNILIGDYGETLLADWGFSTILKSQSAEAHFDAELLNYAPVRGAGTLPYMSPEQALRKEVTRQSDVYGLGAILFQILTGSPPVSDEGGYCQILNRVQKGELRFSLLNEKNIPRQLAEICKKALSLNPKDRYGAGSNKSEGEVSIRDDVDRWLSGQPVKACSETMIEIIHRKLRSNPSLVTGVLVFSFAVAVLSFILLRHNVVLKNANQVAVEAKQRANRTAKELANTVVELERKEEQLEQTVSDLRRKEQQLQHTVEDLQDKERALVEKGGELSKAAWLGYSVIEGAYNGENPISRIATSFKNMPSIGDPKISARVRLLVELESLFQIFHSREPIFTKLAKVKNSLEELDRLVDLDPDLGLTYLARAQVRSQIWDQCNGNRMATMTAKISGIDVPTKDDVIADFNKAIAEMRGCSFAYSGRAFFQPTNDEMLTDLTRAIELDPSNGLAHRPLGELCEKKEDYEHAVSHFVKTIPFIPVAQSLFGQNGWNQRTYKLRICTNAIKWARKAETSYEKLKANAYLRLYSSSLDKFETIEMAFWTFLLSEINGSPSKAIEYIKRLKTEDFGTVDKSFNQTLAGIRLVAVVLSNELTTEDALEQLNVFKGELELNRRQKNDLNAIISKKMKDVDSKLTSALKDFVERK